MVDPRAALKARAEAAFRKVTKLAHKDASEKGPSVSAHDTSVSASRPVETTEGAMEEYLGRQEAERTNLAKLREQRLAAEAKAASVIKTKRKPFDKGKR